MAVTTDVVNAHSVIAIFDGRPVNQPVSFTLLRGQLGLLMGGNGSGKTTILRVLLGEVQFQASRLEVFGVPPPIERPWELTRFRVRVIPQFPVLPVSLTVQQYLAAWASCTLRAEGDKHGTSHRALSSVLSNDLRIPGGTRIGNLSFGQRRMVELLSACAAQPDLLLADEPLAGLARAWVPLAMAALNKVRQGGCAVLAVDHQVHRGAWDADWTVEVEVRT